MKRKIKGGLTSVSLGVFVADTSSTTGAGLSGVTNSSSGLVLEYRRAGQSTWTSVTPVSKTLGTYTSGGIVADGSLAGAYEVDFPDAAFAAGARFVLCRIRGVTNMLPVLIEVELDAVDYQDATRFGLGAIPNVVQGNSGALPTGDASGRVTVIANQDKTGYSLTQSFPGNFATLAIDGSGRVTVGSNADKTGYSLTQAFPANFSALSIAVNGQINSVGIVDELGPSALSANSLEDLIAAATWNSLTTATWATNSFGKHILISDNNNRSVKVVGAGAGHVAADIHAIQPAVIVAGSFAANAIDANALAADAATEIATAVGNLQTISRLDSMIESNGAGQFRFDTIALSMAPTGGGGGGTGTGANTVTLTVLLAGSPVEGAKVRLSKGGESYLGTTSVAGQVVFNVDNGTWLVAITSPNTTFTGANLVVTGNQSASYTVTAISITPSAPGNVTGYWLVLGANGLPESGAVLSMQAVSVECGNPGLALDTAVRTATSDGAGVAQFSNLTPGVRYQAWRGTGAKLYVSIPLDASGSLELSSLLGSP